MKPTIAAFDFDGTITTRDTLFMFLFYAVGTLRASWYLLLSLPDALFYLLGQISRQIFKERVLTRFFKGMPMKELQEKGVRFAKEKIPYTIRPEAEERIQWHISQGHRCLLISASIDVYLIPWAEQMGIQEVLSTRLAIDSTGKITGKLLGLNCRGVEKIKRLEELAGPRQNYALYAYGNSAGDKELLEAADFPYYKRMTDVR